jgi:hypothetical protein
MKRFCPGWHASSPFLIGLTILTAPTVANAAWFGVRNDSQIPVVFQGASVVNNVVRRGKPHLLQPGQEAWELVQPGPKIISVYDARVPSRVLFEGPIVCGNLDMFFSIQVGVVVVPPGVQVPQARLIPAKPRTQPGAPR